MTARLHNRRRAATVADALNAAAPARRSLGQRGVVDDERTTNPRKPFVPADLTAAVRRVLDG